MEDAKAVREARVGGPGVYEVGGPQLHNPSQPLESGKLYDCANVLGHCNVLPERVSNRVLVVVGQVPQGARTGRRWHTAL